MAADDAKEDGNVPRPVAKPPHSVDVHVGGKIRQRRRMLGMSQSAVALALGISFQQLQKYESGANRVGASRLYQLAGVLGLAPSAFFSGLAREDEGQREAIDQFDAEALRLVAGWRAISDDRMRRAIAVLINAARTVGRD